MFILNAPLSALFAVEKCIGLDDITSDKMKLCRQKKPKTNKKQQLGERSDLLINYKSYEAYLETTLARFYALNLAFFLGISA